MRAPSSLVWKAPVGIPGLNALPKAGPAAGAISASSNQASLPKTEVLLLSCVPASTRFLLGFSCFLLPEEGSMTSSLELGVAELPNLHQGRVPRAW